MKYLYVSLLSLLAVYLLVLIFIYFNQRNLLYHPGDNNYLDDKAQFSYKEVLIEVDRDIKLKSWLIDKDLEKYKTLVFFHGNAGNLFNRVHKLNELNKLDINILIISWRGFSGNSGKPTEKNLYQDAQKSIEWLNNKGIKNEKIILYGESLGTAVATEIGQNKKFAGIILESPFTSMIEMGKKYYPIFPVKLLIKDKYETKNKIKNIKFPILIMHGKKDKLVPFNMGNELYNLANEPKFKYFAEEDGHMVEFDIGLKDEINKFLKSLE